MKDKRLATIQRITEAIPTLTAGKLHWIDRVLRVFSAEYKFDLTNTTLFDEVTLNNFGEAMRVHHSFSSEPFSKDKFEYVLVEVLNMSGRKAELAPKGNRGHDVSVEGLRLSLKTQANNDIKPHIIWISKFMELGKGQWSDDPSELIGLRDQFLDHLQNYDKVLMLRALMKSPSWAYELVEIPLPILKLAATGTLEMMVNSKQSPKPGYCHIRGDNNITIFDMYFDGGTERKLQIKNLVKARCLVHATWRFVIPE